MPMIKFSISHMIALSSACMLVTGCGGDEPVVEQKPIERGVVTSALECADIYEVEIAKCQTAIRDAISAHENSSTKYNRLAKCEAAEGPQRCERAGQTDFSRRLQAFQLVLSDPPTAEPLYATTDTSAGFLTGNGTAILLDQDEIKFSDQAAVIAERNADLPDKSAGGGL